MTESATGKASQAVEIGEKFFEYRDYTPIPIILLLLISAKPTPASALLGFVLILIGELWRIYSVSFIGTVSRTRNVETSGASLVKEGPYGLMRNPLYVGNFFICMGFAIYGAQLYLVVLTAALFAVQYYFIVAFEETLMRKKFANEFDDYCKSVPAWIPSKVPSPNDFTFRNVVPAIASEKRTLTAILVLIGILLLKS